MIPLEISASVVFSVHSQSDFTWQRKKLDLSWLMFNNLTKTNENPLSWGKKFNAIGFVSFQ